jgi:WXG100 family type VII secretion target
MASRTESMQSHQFTLQRVTRPAPSANRNPTASPVRRSAGLAFAGVMIAMVALAAVAASSVLRPGDTTSWRDAKSVIIERETCARLVGRDRVLADLESDARPLVATWSGTAPESYQQRQNTWREVSKDLVSILCRIRVALDDAANDDEGTETANANLFR